MWVLMGAIIYRVNKKFLAKPTEGESTPQYKKVVLQEHVPFEAWFSNCCFLTKKMPKVCLSFCAGIAGCKLLVCCFLPPSINGAVYHNFL
jgi:hypothetical protein